MSDTLLGFFGALAFSVPALLALIILICSLKVSKSKSAIMLWGAIAAFLMVVEFLLLVWAADFRGAFGPTGYGFAKNAGLFFVICLLGYFVVAIKKFP